MRAAFAVLGVVAAVALAAPAHADEGQYLDILSNTPGFTINPMTSVLLVGAGNAICGDLHNGTSLADAQNHAMAYPGATNFGAKAMVAAAQQALCPDTLGR